ncbi:hypothetical protein DPMN_118841, partial [Dreissena polymorpha]
YIGSFSVNGEDQSTRTEFVQHQLANMHKVEKSKKVLLVISLSGVKVCSSSGESVYMAHALKRISYAACDPEHCQFAFLAREPKGHIKIQFCHAFITQTPEEAEELNTIIGNAFKMAYAKQKTSQQPTFNELIERQLAEQRAKFDSYQEQASRALAQRLNEIATPTAAQRMEMRRQSSADDLLTSGPSTPATSEKDYILEKTKVWAKHAADKVQHWSPAKHFPIQSDAPTFSSSSRVSNHQQQTASSSTATASPQHSNALRRSDPSYSMTKRNSNPVQLTPTKQSASTSPKRNSTPPLSSLHNFQVVTIRESLENNVNNSNRFKGSPVTALKDEIDRRFSTSGGLGNLGTLDSGLGWGLLDQLDGGSQHTSPQHQHHYGNMDLSLTPSPLRMQNRPLPAIPADPLSVDFVDHRASPKLRNWTSIDDEIIQNQSRSSGQSRLRDSPKRRPQRPRSEVIFDSKFTAISENGFDQTGVYIYGYKPHSDTFQNGSDQYNFGQSNAHNTQRTSPHISPHKMPMQGNQQRETTVQYSVRKDNCDKACSSPKEGYSVHSGYDNMRSVTNGKVSSPLHFQNHTTGEPVEGVCSTPKKEKRSGLESLMGLDRSHIEDETLRNALWYQAGIPRDVALEILSQEDIGSFIVRDSSTHPGCFALSVRVPKFSNPSGISHYLIMKTADGVKLKGLDKEWSNVVSLVTHHSIMAEMLPCTLKVPRDTTNPAFKNCDKDDKEEDPDYQRLADFSSMMEALKE